MQSTKQPSQPKLFQSFMLKQARRACRILWQFRASEGLKSVSGNSGNSGSSGSSESVVVAVGAAVM